MKRVYFKILLLTLLTRFTVFILFASRKNSPSNNSIAFSIGFEQRHNNFENMFEAFFHVKNGKSPFSGNVFHGNPLLLYFLLLLKINKLSYFKSKFALHLLTSICDFIAAINLMEIVNFVETKDAAKSPKTKEKSTFSILIAILYVSNPFAIFNSIISFSTIHYCLLFVTVKNALKRRTLSSCLFFSLLIFTEIYALLFFPLLIAIFYKKEETIFNKVSKIALLTLLVAFFVGTPIYLLSKEKGANFLKESYLFLLSNANLNPNFGMFWYLFAQMLERFRKIFLIIFNTQLIFVSIPISIAFWREPYFLFAILTFVLIIFKPYPIFADVYIFGVILLSIKRHLAAAKNLVLYLAIAIFGVAGDYVLWFLWIHFESVNINFVYANSLIYNGAMVLLILDVVYSFLKLRINAI